MSCSHGVNGTLIQLVLVGNDIREFPPDEQVFKDLSMTIYGTPSIFSAEESVPSGL